jgi:hypothetical protein
MLITYIDEKEEFFVIVTCKRFKKSNINTKQNIDRSMNLYIISYKAFLTGNMALYKTLIFAVVYVPLFHQCMTLIYEIIIHKNTTAPDKMYKSFKC